MTYCVGLTLNKGLVFMSDTRTNAGVDNISVFKKMFNWQTKGDRAIVMMTAGNLATTQAVVSLLDERSKAPGDRQPTILEAPSMFQVARMVADTLREVVQSHAPAGQSADAAFNATIILGGQIKGSDPRLFLIYPEGNFVEASGDTPFFQIGETKYGRPILDRVMNFQMPMEEATKIALISMDSTLRSNMSVGLPLDLFAYRRDQAGTYAERRINETDQDYVNIRDGWGFALRSACQNINDITMSWC